MGLRTEARKFMLGQGMKLPQSLLRGDEAFIRNAAKDLTRDDIVLDLGAHIGRASVEFSHRAGKVYAFEPHPGIFKELKKNMRNYPRVKPINKAISDQDSVMKLYYEELDSGKQFEGSTLVADKDNNSYEHSFDVETIDLARFIQELGKPVRMIKMDIEGAEYQVLESLIETPAMAQIGMVNVECHADRVVGLPEHKARVLARIDALGLTEKFDFTWP